VASPPDQTAETQQAQQGQRWNRPIVGRLAGRHRRAKECRHFEPGGHGRGELGRLSAQPIREIGNGQVVAPNHASDVPEREGRTDRDDRRG